MCLSYSLRGNKRNMTSWGNPGGVVACGGDDRRKVLQQRRSATITPDQNNKPRVWVYAGCIALRESQSLLLLPN